VKPARRIRRIRYRDQKVKESKEEEASDSTSAGFGRRRRCLRRGTRWVWRCCTRSSAGSPSRPGPSASTRRSSSTTSARGLSVCFLPHFHLTLSVYAPSARLGLHLIFRLCFVCHVVVCVLVRGKSALLIGGPKKFVRYLCKMK
jgi:hypothetical protein